MIESERPAVLCVDDEPEILSALERTLRREPYPVLTAASGDEALERIEQDGIGVVVSDERMPQMSGLELLTEIRRRRPWIRLVILTGYPGRPLPAPGDDAPVDLLMAKPWNDTDLKSNLRRLIRQVARIPGERREDPAFDLGGEGG